MPGSAPPPTRTESLIERLRFPNQLLLPKFSAAVHEAADLLEAITALPDEWETKDMTNPNPLITVGAEIAFKAAASQLRALLEKANEAS